jgi:hypothetical protein
MVSKRERSEAGRRLASLRRVVAVGCAFCGKAVRGTKKKRYCSAACRQAAYRARREPKEGEIR